MRFAPPNPLRIADRASGLNSLSVRSYNERLVLSLLLQNATTTRLEIGERTGLSAQTISVIVRSLEQEGLVSRGEAQRGRVGPPTTPLMLNSDGAYSVGVSVGYRRTHIALVDFVGNVRYGKSLNHEKDDGPGDAELIVAEVRRAIHSIPETAQGRIAGIGLGLPDTVEGHKLNVEQFHRSLETAVGLPVFIQNDIAAAAAGESLFGTAKQLEDYLFFYLGARLHSRLILNHQIYNPSSKISYDVGALALERMLASPEAREGLWHDDEIWKQHKQEVGAWRDHCVSTLENAVTSLGQFVDVRTVIVSSFVPTFISRQLCLAVESRLPGIKALPGSSSFAPKAIGAASLPFSSRFMVD